MNKKEKIFTIFYNLFFVVFSVFGLIESAKIVDTTLIILWSFALGMWVCEFIESLCINTKNEWKKK